MSATKTSCGFSSSAGKNDTFENFLMRLEPYEVKVYLPVSAPSLELNENDDSAAKRHHKNMLNAFRLAVGSSDTFKHLRHQDRDSRLDEVWGIVRNETKNTPDHLKKIIKRQKIYSNKKFNAFLDAFKLNSTADLIAALKKLEN